MYSILLAIIYLAFISLGLPDSLLGAAWPVMHEQLDAPIAYAGILSMIISGGTIVSSLLADRLIRKLGTGLVTAISILMTAMALLGFSTSDSFVKLCLWAVPYGLGAGAVDAALNNYIALHYASRHIDKGIRMAQWLSVCCHNTVYISCYRNSKPSAMEQKKYVCVGH
jgi:MFS family permease